MTIVAQVIKNKSEQAIFTISPEATVLEAITIMAEKGIGALVVAEGEQVVGILSERDYTRKVTLMERSSYSTTVAEIMTAKVITVGLNNTVEECLRLMTDRHLRHLPVLDNGKLVGFISIGDLVKAAMEDQKVLIEQLKQYISG
ncbi:TPA: CBS domain-containing protein [Acinetobacter baumannii]|uniref:CBS domain-containing protein n=1 Tax=Acinetobacter baumannii TaxID=470 RepID=UPI0001AF0E71|nr:CBS domain-containing protein [Acinetobacter baumannii]EHU1902196.1 CBS domain-containing protein [Acinetobacter baumannii]EHU1919743.1 CBS domain-containing protein [Acinetobacter baumannii]EHU1963502.1 CBS domain-containing protein [Acinetobacter baumannii]EKP46011.1 CBS domain protein [Acinetobacter baumannii OIFC111]EKU3892887.1 CBS domain-containing protein [Acinetobacter baumannii]